MKLVLILMFFSTVVWAQPYNICTVTLNSKDEIEVFKKHLPSDKFNFIELTEAAKNTATTEQQKNNFWLYGKWFDQICEQKISCDVLIISSHQWQGRFFGEGQTSPFRLTNDDLRKRKCENSCGNFFENLKQVYLFGCNTLTAKDGDYASFSEYLKYLAYDNHSHNPNDFLDQAHTDFSRAPISNNYSMRSIFANVPQIYGFERRSPLGFMVAPSLEKYFSKIKASGFESRLKSAQRKADPELLKLLSSQSMIMESGFTANDENVVLRDKMICEIKSQKSFIDRLDVVKNYLLNTKNFIQFKMILEFIWPNDKSKMSPYDIDKVEFLRGNAERQEFFNKAFEKNPSFGGKLDIVTIGVYFGLYTIDEAAGLQKKAIDSFYKEKMNTKDKDILCTTLTFQKNIYLSDEDINAEWVKSKNQLEAAQCIKRIQVKPIREIGSVKKKANNNKVKENKSKK